jgi:cyclophilin family peptidyl-prolyl cis-trans isomerase
MKNIFNIVLIAISCITFSVAQDKKQEGIFAEISTSKGKIVVELEYKKTPITVANFVSLAEGKNTQVAEKLKGKPYYNGLKFHRVIANFMIQGGDPDGNGSGGPGYKFVDEITDLTHKSAGVLSMANAGAGTNGSQFFITHKETAWLDGKHTVFGHVVSGQDVVNKIAQDDVINSIVIIRNGKEAKKFKAEKIFADYFSKKEESDKAQEVKNESARKALAEIALANQKKQAEIEAAKRKELEGKLVNVKAEKIAEFTTLKATSTKTASGLQYTITKKGTGSKPADGSTIYIHYAGYFEDGSLFDSSYSDISKKYGKFDQNRADQNGYAPFPFQYGSKTGLIPGFLEGVNLLSFGDKVTLFIPSNLGYGEKGAGNVIPPNATLIFELEILESQTSSK